MTDEEFAKLKLIRAINPDIDPSELEKYFCTACSDYNCRSNIDRMMENRKTEKYIRFYIWQGKNTNRIVDIHKCFKGEKID